MKNKKCRRNGGIVVSDLPMEISIPADNDGFVLFQCPTCGDFFKIRPDDYEDDTILEISCPNCGLRSENYFTEDVFELTETMASNVAMEMIYNEMKKWERQFKGSFVSFKAGKKPKSEPEKPIVSGIEALQIATFECCHRQAKIKPIIKFYGSYCPFCGVKNFETE